VQSTTRLGRFPLRHLARQVGALGFKFLLVLSLSMMVRIMEHRAKTSKDFVMEQEVASSAPRVPDRPDSGTAAVHAMQQHTPPPSSTTSPGAMKQWHDDVDQLLGMAHSTSTRSRPRSSRRQREATASVRSPSVRGA
jgi:hypothetical protein